MVKECYLLAGLLSASVAAAEADGPALPRAHAP